MCKLYLAIWKQWNYIIRGNKKGMELVQVAILIAIAVGLGLIFKERIGQFVNNTFDSLAGSGF